MPCRRAYVICNYGLSICKEWFSTGKWDVVILDEITIAVHLRLLDVNQAIDVVSPKYAATEVIITGRYAPRELIDITDLVTDMLRIKHYYSKGVLSRDGSDH